MLYCPAPQDLLDQVEYRWLGCWKAALLGQFTSTANTHRFQDSLHSLEQTLLDLGIAASTGDLDTERLEVNGRGMKVAGQGLEEGGIWR